MANKKMKFRNAEEKRAYEENQRSWDTLKAKYEPAKRIKDKNTALVYELSNPPGRPRVDLPSKSTPGGNTSAVNTMKYTGTLIKGIGTMHKSNAIPILNDTQAKEIASMRR